MNIVQGPITTPMKGTINAVVADANETQSKACSHEHCDRPATHIASGHKRVLIRAGYGTGYFKPGHPRPRFYCLGHAEEVSAEGKPAYRISCPNCGCMFGVGQTE